MLQAWLMLAGVLLALLVALLAGTACLMALMLLRPPRMTDGKAAYVLRRLSPGDLGLEFETVRFVVKDHSTGQDLTLVAWWIPHSSAQGRTAVIVHGYADAKVGAIAWAPLLHSLGLNILAVDLRAHGESGGRFCTGGYFERHDLDQVVNQIRAQRPHQTRQMVLYGISLGAAVAAACAAQRDDLSGVILECPFADFRDAARQHATLMGLPGRFLQAASLRLAEWMSGADFSAARPVDTIPKITCPLMIVQSARDSLIGDCANAQIADAAAQRVAIGNGATGADRTELWSIADSGHVLGICADPPEYARRIGEFIARATARPGPPDLPRAHRKTEASGSSHGEWQ